MPNLHLLPERLRRAGNSLLGPALDHALKRRLASGTGWSFVGSAASRAAVLAGSVAAARILGQDSFGQFSMVQSTLIVMGSLAGFGMSVTATKHVAEYRRTDPPIAGGFIRTSARIAMMTGGAMSVLAFLFGPWIARTVLAAPELGNLVQIGALALLWTALASAQTGSLSGLEAFRRIAAATTAGTLIAQSVLVSGALAFGLQGATLGMVAGTGLTCALLALALRRETRAQGIPTANTPSIRWATLLGFSLPALMSSLITGPVQWAAQALLAREPDGFAGLGSYSAASQWMSALMFLPSILGQAVLPMLSERIGARDQNQALRLMKASIRINALAIWPLALVGAACSPWLMKLYGASFSADWPAMAYSMLTAAILATLIPVGQVLAASNRMWIGLWMNVGWGTALLIFTLLLVDRGAAGLALARLLAYALHAVWTIGYAWHLLRRSAR